MVDVQGVERRAPFLHGPREPLGEILHGATHPSGVGGGSSASSATILLPWIVWRSVSWMSRANPCAPPNARRSGRRPLLRFGAPVAVERPENEGA